MLVPVEGLLAVAIKSAVAEVVAVYIDEAIALGHLLGGFGDKIDARPGGVAHEFYAVFMNGVIHGLHVALVVGNVSIVVDGIGTLAVRYEFFFFTKSVFDDEQRFAVAVIEIHE